MSERQGPKEPRGEPAESRYDAALRRGAFVNLLGLIGKLLYPVFFLMLTWLFGPSTVGVFLLAAFVAEIVVSASAAGFVDAVVIYASHHADRASHERDAADALHAALRTGMGVPLMLSLVLGTLIVLAADPFVARVYPERAVLVPTFQIIGLSLPFITLSQVTIAATKARMHMGYDALFNGFFRPVLLLGFSALAWVWDGGVPGIALAQLATYALLATLGSWAFARHYEVRPVLRRPWHFDRRVIQFALPQSINMTFSKYQTRLDVMMLGALGHSDFQLGFYGAAALLTSHLREIRLIFSQALGPIAARHHASGEPRELEEALGRVTRWTTTLFVPIALVMVVLRRDLLKFVDASYGVQPSLFMVVLLWAPFMSCALGLAGNLMIFTGHSRYNLFNSLLAAALNTVFNLWLIPIHGLVGAAIATALSATLVSALQLVELAWLEHIRLRLRHVWAPHLGLVGLGLVVWGVWDPATWNAPLRAGASLAIPVVFGLLMFLLGHPEVTALVKRRWRLTRATTADRL